ncbi:50S ribosomal protein L30e [Candidatus Bathyarchaeota archaeon]|jgi:large subunit ribosomal protein L30e|nr:50S ribosomal protein L30e [Candidatus Bathyarchaeota archaeon]
MIDINKALTMTMKTGKVLFGGNKTLNAARVGKAKLIIVAFNCPKNIREDIEYYSKLSNIPSIVYNGSSLDLGMACGKPFMVSALTIKDPGNSNILQLTEAMNV